MKLKGSKILSSNWVITLTATLIGVFGALFLNEWISTKNVRDQKSIATKNILSEIKENKTSIEENIKDHRTLMSIIMFMEKYIDNENRLIIDSDSLKVFRTDFPNIFIVQDSTLLESGKYHYRGEMDLNFDISYVSITNIAWKTLKNSALTNSYDFDCLMFLEQMEIIHEETLKQERKFIEIMKNANKYDEDDYQEELKLELDFLIEYENGLLDLYNNSEEKLNNCG